jgi:CubicO group peptidase (beta-lactamase class C family)
VLVGVVTVALVAGLIMLGVRSVPRTGVPVGLSRWAFPDDIDEFVKRQARTLNLPGVAVVVLRNGARHYTGFFGTAGQGQSVTGETPFVLGSTSKQFTGLAVQRLIGEGRLTLDTPLAAILPEFAEDPDKEPDIHIGDLLGHTSALSTTAGLRQWGWRPARPTSIQDNVADLARERRDTSLGGAFEYSNANYDLLGAVIERVAGKPYPDALRELVTEPLGLRGTTADPATLVKAAGYQTWFGMITAPTPAPATPGAVPSSFISSTANDLTTLLQAHLRSVDTAMTRQTLAAARVPLAEVNQYARYASGWFVRPLWEQHPLDADPLDRSLPTCITHEGTAYRSMSFLLACPVNGFGVVALTNTGAGADPGHWTQFQEDLVHLVLGTAAPVLSRDPVQAQAPLIMIGSLVLQATSVAWLLVAVASRRRILRPVAVSGGVSLAVLWAAWLYAPNVSGSFVPIPALWASVPDLGLATMLASVLAVVAAVATLRAATRKDRIPAGA